MYQERQVLITEYYNASAWTKLLLFGTLPFLIPYASFFEILMLNYPITPHSSSEITIIHTFFI